MIKNIDYFVLTLKSIQHNMIIGLTTVYIAVATKLIKLNSLTFQSKTVYLDEQYILKIMFSP